MSFANSFVNTIGRELGRDIYRSLSATSSTNSKRRSDMTRNEQILQDIEEFTISVQEKTTVTRLVNLVEKIKTVNYEDYDFSEVFVNLDKKIDLARENLTKQEYLTQIDDLDSANEQIFKLALERHKNWIKERISYNKSHSKNDKSLILSFILGFFGLSPILGIRTTKINFILQIIGSVVYLSSLYYYYTYWSGPEAGVLVNKNACIGFMIFIGICSGIISLFITRSYNSHVQSFRVSVETLQTYLDRLSNAELQLNS
jgi:hypothetical protein